ncbi:MAG: hypothetical protein IKH39_01760 [Candidatus Methanomethylophilaceae archaeon]|nr:hypothetical protein [Candidatus Methanomethylophilaceae archaeon]
MKLDFQLVFGFLGKEDRGKERIVAAIDLDSYLRVNFRFVLYEGDARRQVFLDVVRGFQARIR